MSTWTIRNTRIPLSRSTRDSDIYDPATRRTAVTVGLLFLTATATFATGDFLIRSYFSGDAGTAESSRLAVGVALQAGAAIAGAAIGFASLRLLSRFDKTLAKGYVTFRSLEAVMIAGVGTYMLASKNFVEPYELLVYAFTGTAGLMFARVLQKSKLVSGWLARLGIVGYVAILMSIPSDLFGLAPLRSAVGITFYAPGAVFELILPILLIVKGFRRTETRSLNR